MKVTARVLTEKISTATLTLSVSKAKTYEGCQAKYKFCYLDKLPRVDQDFHVFGKFLHQILENFHRAIINDPSLAENWKAVLKKAWDDAYEEYSKELTGVQFKDAQALIKEYEEILEKRLPNVIAVEKPFYILINDEILLNGFIDRIQIDEDGIIHVLDYKTTKDPKYLKDDFQLLSYCYALMLEDPTIEEIRASFILLKHKFKYLTKKYTREEVFLVGEKFAKYALNIQEEKLWRPNPQFLCKYCDYIEHCKDGKNFLVKKGMLKEKKVPFTGIRKW